MAHPQARILWAVMQAHLGRNGENIRGGAFRGMAPRRPHYSAAQVSDEETGRQGAVVSAESQGVLLRLDRKARRLALAVAQTANPRRRRSYRHQLERLAARV